MGFGICSPSSIKPERVDRRSGRPAFCAQRSNGLVAHAAPWPVTSSRPVQARPVTSGPSGAIDVSIVDRLNRRAVPAEAGDRVVPVTRCLPELRGVVSRCKWRIPNAACCRPTSLPSYEPTVLPAYLRPIAPSNHPRWSCRNASAERERSPRRTSRVRKWRRHISIAAWTAGHSVDTATAYN